MQELLRVLVDKASVGALVHSDCCRVAGRPLSDGPSTPDELAALLMALQSAGWIRRGRTPEQSRFWHLLTDEQAPMFGVFDPYEQQLLSDWIEADTERPATALALNRFRLRPAIGSVAGASNRLHSDASVE